MIDLRKINLADDVRKILSSADATNLQPRLHQVPFLKRVRRGANFAEEQQSRYFKVDDTREFDHRIFKRVIKELPNVFRVPGIYKSSPFKFPVTVAK